jgi:hypothetical protein
LADVPELTPVPSKVMIIPASLALKPEPLTVMEVPGGPLALPMAIAALTVKVRGGAVPAVVREPKALIVWGPEAESGMIKVALQLPREVLKVPGVTGFPSKVMVMPVSFEPKPEPVTVIWVPGGPLARLKVRTGVTLNTEVGAVPSKVIEP